jgi:predicted phage terminase large subunit-like protein
VVTTRIRSDSAIDEWLLNELLPSLNQDQFDDLMADVEADLQAAESRSEREAVTFASFVDLASNGKYQWYPYCARLTQVLQRVADGEIKRLMVFMPPRHGKSELVSRLFSAYFLYRFPEKWCGINSYAADLAYTFSRNARDNYTYAGGELKGSTYAVSHWETGLGGGLWAAGVGGPITGKGFDLGVIDDPVKNAEEAASETNRRKQKDWFDSTFSTREEPDAAIIVIQTRWHEDDLSGYLLDKESEEPERWHIVHFEAIKDEEPPEYPETCTIEPDPREPGEALAPKRYPIEKLKRFSRRIGSYFFGALFQQRPKPREGNMFKRSWFEIVRKVPAHCRRVRYWDKAGTEGGGAFTCGVLVAYDPDEHIYYIEDLVRGQWSAGQREAIIKQTADLDDERYKQVDTYVEQEGGSGGKESAENTIKNLAGHSIRADRPTGDKTLRAEPLSAQAEAKNVKIKNAPWASGFLDRLTAFPNGTYKDDVDAASGAFNKLVLMTPAELEESENPFY